MPDLDRTTARALVEAGYMPLTRYLEMFGESADDAPSIAPGIDEHQHAHSVLEAPLRLWRRLTSTH